jgi:hypothetical protein
VQGGPLNAAQGAGNNYPLLEQGVWAGNDPVLNSGNPTWNTSTCTFVTAMLKGRSGLFALKAAGGFVRCMMGHAPRLRGDEEGGGRSRQTRQTTRSRPTSCPPGMAADRDEIAAS